MTQRMQVSPCTWTLLAVVIMAVKAAPAVASPCLAAEDGTILLARYATEADWARCWQPYNGYSSLMPNLMACVFCRLPLHWIPHAMAASAAIVAVVARGAIVGLVVRHQRPPVSDWGGASHWLSPWRRSTIMRC